MLKLAVKTAHVTPRSSYTGVSSRATTGIALLSRLSIQVRQLNPTSLLIGKIVKCTKAVGLAKLKQ